MAMHNYIFLSPHFDDVALSCGGLVWDLAQLGHRVEIWTLMGGFPPDDAYSEFAQQNHLRWGLSGRTAIRMRRAEDLAACEVLGAQPHHFDWPDAIYRRDPATAAPLVTNNEALFGKPPEETLVKAIQARLETEILQAAFVVCPLGLGGHLDHLAVSQAAKTLEGEISYYADYPYILDALGFPGHQETQLIKKPHPLGAEALSHWQDAVLCYKSQISDFWRDEAEAQLALRNYLAGGGGCLWEKT